MGRRRSGDMLRVVVVKPRMNARVRIGGQGVLAGKVTSWQAHCHRAGRSRPAVATVSDHWKATSGQAKASGGCTAG